MRVALTALAAALALLVPAATASGGAAEPAHTPVGAVPHAGAPRAFGAVHAASAGDLALTDPANGWVMRTNTTYAIYWVPSGATACGGAPCHVSANYESLINQYFTDVAAASGRTDNVYATDTQYYDATGAIAYDSSFSIGSNSYVDMATPFPANQCAADTADPVCLTDAQLQTAIQRAIDTNGWPEGRTNLFFIMLPENVGVCFNAGAGSDCTTNSFCAYHNFYADGSRPVIYAVEPYDKTITGCYATTHGQGSPSGDDADATINTISHEQNEAITDPWGTGWYAADGSENGDLCAWKFGTPLGTVGGEPYNQVINGHYYSLQQEWSNTSPVGTDGKCVLGYSAGLLSPPTNIDGPAISGAAAQGKILSVSSGTWVGTPTGYAYQWQRCASDGSGCTDIAGATGSTYQLSAVDVGQLVRSQATASNSGGDSEPAVSAFSDVVVPVPASTGAPIVSGIAAVGKTLSTTAGDWNTAASYAYQWQRCAPDGTGCAPIPGATGATHTVVAGDAGQTIEAVVSATNAAGTASAASVATGVVIDVPRATGAPRISGNAKVGQKLIALRGTWSGPPTRYEYQWLLCSAHGVRCVAIQGAGRAVYRVTPADAGHRLRLRITAADVAGLTRATTRATARVGH